MTALADARAHLAKAQEFFDAAGTNLEYDHYSAAASNAVISGINSKDAICLRLAGTTGKTENHGTAINELKVAGANGPYSERTKQAATALGRLLSMKNKSQYQTVAVTRASAAKAIEWAERMLETATEIVKE